MEVEEPFGACPHAIDDLVRVLPYLDMRLADFCVYWRRGAHVVAYPAAHRWRVRLDEADAIVSGLPATFIGLADAAVRAIITRATLLAGLAWVEAQESRNSSLARLAEYVGRTMHRLAAEWAEDNARQANERDSIPYWA